jgi:myb proto-oncogene protein
MAALLLAAVGHDINKIVWTEIAKKCSGREARQCWARWKCQLDPGIDHSAFPLQEVELMVQMHARVGNKYATIARCLPGRTTDKVKQHLREVGASSSEREAGGGSRTRGGW